MKNKLWKIFVAAGAVMIAAALGLFISNKLESRRAEEYSAEALEVLKENITVETAAENDETGDDLFSEYEEPAEKKLIDVDGYRYCGYLTIEPLGLELPVIDGFSYDGLKRAPCRYSGSAEENDLIIAAHNYDPHFGRINELSAGERIVFTDTSGRSFNYKVSEVEVIDGRAVESMFSGASEEWALTLFTCTLSGMSRVTVRAEFESDSK